MQTAADSVKAPQSVVLVGAGGHAKVLIETLRAGKSDKIHLVGLTDHDPSPRRVLGLDVLGDDSILPRLRAQGVTGAVLALGANALRERIALTLEKLGFELLNVISPSAFVSPSARLGRGLAVITHAVIQAESLVDDYAIINTGSIVDHDGHLGRACHVGPGCVLAGAVTVGARVLLGAGTSVIPGVRIGEDAIVGAGACVVRDIPPGVVAFGVPAVISHTQTD